MKCVRKCNMLRSMQHACGQVQHADRAREKHVDKHHMLHISCEMHVDKYNMLHIMRNARGQYNMPRIAAACEMRGQIQHAAHIM